MADASKTAGEITKLLAEIENPRSKHAAEDLLGDWERQGFLKQAQIDRLAVVRALSPTELAEVSSFLSAVGARDEEEPQPDELLLCESLASQSDLELQRPSPTTDRADVERLLTPTEVIELSNAVQLGIRAGEALAEGGALANEQRLIIKRGERARERLIICNQKLVNFVAKHFQVHPAYSLEDLIQEGIVGLMKAVERFDPSRGFKFSTYAMWWIRQAILRALANRASTIRVPVHRVNDIFKYKRTIELLRQENPSAEPLVSEIATALQWTMEKVVAIEELSRLAYVSTNVPLREDDGDELGDTLVSNVPSPSDICDANERKDFVGNSLHRLTPRERDVIERRFGLKTFGIPETLEEIGRDYGLTRERIRQIQEEAIEALGPAAKRWISKGLTDS